MSIRNRLDKLENTVAANDPGEAIRRRHEQLLFDATVRPVMTGIDDEHSQRARAELAELNRRHGDALRGAPPADPAMLAIVKQRMKARGGISI